MSSRAQQPDTQADVDLRHCLEARPPTSFNMVAGAGSGKTTSLIKGLASTLAMHGERLRLRRQRVACITYTEIAAKEIWADVGNNPLVHVSTIHSFLWLIGRAFQQDIAAWVANRINERIVELQSDASKFSPRVQQKTRDKNARDIVRYEQQREAIAKVRTFAYGTGSDYATGILGHDDIIKMATRLMMDRPLFRSLVAQQFPFIFVDESQDTFPVVVEALMAIQQQEQARFCLGFFGDPMQRIYPTGIGTVPQLDGWRAISKPQNFRSSTTVLNLANAIRRDGDGLVQVGGRKKEEGNAKVPVVGTARLFVLPTDARRDERVAEVRAWIAKANSDETWLPAGENDPVKMLVIVHRMAAKRLGFGDLYAALNDKAPDAFKNGFLDATAWPLRPFVSFLLPLADAVRDGRNFDRMRLLRLHSPLLEKANLKGVNVAERLNQLQALSNQISELMAPASHASIRDVLMLAKESRLVALDPRLSAYLEDFAANEPKANESEHDGAEGDENQSNEINSMAAFLNCAAHQLRPYQKYVHEESPFSTQQGVKGAEYDRVLVVLDDDEGTHFQFSYEKYFGLKELSTRDKKTLVEGGETAVERTRRLFYVCCTRARQDLAVVLFVADPAQAIAHIRGLGLFPEADILSREALA
ncbi:UvrD-helicase domain-containing protein [Falsiroseomonas oryziterrae]|uniref:UvrD-helicase domain-containing protein n=1 Tax=Falsiroseomonas oryziterrae TaxID=2911368 RepID=UPI001EFFF1D9|nr:UvrD-helicase domain-containing protein [Roseomonas sp. NPKOSM-4]